MQTGIETNNEKTKRMYNPKWSTMHEICSQFLICYSEVQSSNMPVQHQLVGCNKLGQD